MGRRRIEGAVQMANERRRAHTLMYLLTLDKNIKHRTRIIGISTDRSNEHTKKPYPGPPQIAQRTGDLGRKKDSVSGYTLIIEH
jgi:hypothetical protein